MNKMREFTGRFMIMINYFNIILFLISLIGFTYSGTPNPPEIVVKCQIVFLVGLIISIVGAFIIRYIRWKYTY